MAEVLGCQRAGKEGGMSVREAEHHMDADMFLDEYLL